MGMKPSDLPFFEGFFEPRSWARSMSSRGSSRSRFFFITFPFFGFGFPGFGFGGAIFFFFAGGGFT